MTSRTSGRRSMTLKAIFATTFVLREDFFRSMNGVEDRMKIIDNKLDKLLLMGKENK